LYLLDGPEVGGDTAFVNQVEAYNRLSPALKQRLHGLKAVHSGVEQVEFSLKRGGVARREPILTEHPLVRTHPATGEKALFVNAGCKYLAFLALLGELGLTKVNKSLAVSSDSRRRRAMRFWASCWNISVAALTSRLGSDGRQRLLSFGM
jgi:hypothetical protein